jgi:hypothetical protein
MEQNDFCPFCDHYIDANDPIIEFPCVHRAHSSCFFRLLNNETHSLAEQYHQCQFCQNGIFETEDEEEDDIEEEQTEEQEEGEIVDNQAKTTAEDIHLSYYERLEKRFNENKEMQKDIKLYIKTKQLCASKRRILQKCTSQKKQEIKHSVDSLREQLKSLLRAQKKNIIQNEAFKSYKGAFFKMTIMRARISKKYNVDMDSLRKAIKHKKGYRRWLRDHRWRDNPGYVLRRAFYGMYIRC